MRREVGWSEKDVALLQCWILISAEDSQEKRKKISRKKDPADALTVAYVFVVSEQLRLLFLAARPIKSLGSSRDDEEWRRETSFLPSSPYLLAGLVWAVRMLFYDYFMVYGTNTIGDHDEVENFFSLSGGEYFFSMLS